MATRDPYHLIGDDRDYSTTDGLLDRDATIASRCRARLLTRRGGWSPDLAFGSRLHEIRLLKSAQQVAMIYVEEALADLVRDGEIAEINLLEFVTDYTTGAIGARIEVVLPLDEVVPLGVIPLGG